MLTQDLVSGKSLARLSALIKKLDLGLEVLSCCANGFLLADDGRHIVLVHLGDDEGAENVADLADQSCFNHLDGHLVDEPFERYLLDEKHG